MSIAAMTFDCGGEIKHLYPSTTQLQGSSKSQLYHQKKPYTLGSTKALSYNDTGFADKSKVPADGK